MVNVRFSIFIFGFLCLISVPKIGVSQSLLASNIHFRTIGDRIEIFYDLPENNDSLNVKVVFRKKSSPDFKYQPKSINGDAGIGVFSGTNKKIVWDIKNEPDYLFTGNGFYFKIKADKIPKRDDAIAK